tara:strand:+ start:3543 stop:3878 length:336 start_codon:yes stop_codon:yes gene_type:complete
MAITHTVTVNNLIVLNDGTDVVSQIDVEILSVDDSDPSNLKQTSYATCQVDTSGGTSAAGFVPYGNLTETAIKNWISTAPAVSKMKTNAETWIEKIKNPPTPPEVSKTLPW